MFYSIELWTIVARRFDDFQNAVTITNAISKSTGGGQVCLQ